MSNDRPNSKAGKTTQPGKKPSCPGSGYDRFVCSLLSFSAMLYGPSPANVCIGKLAQQTASYWQTYTVASNTATNIDILLSSD